MAPSAPLDPLLKRERYFPLHIKLYSAYLLTEFEGQVICTYVCGNH